MQCKRNYPAWIDRDHIGTHYDGCEQHHPACAWIAGWRAATNATQDRNPDSDRSTGQRLTPWVTPGEEYE